MPSDVSFADFRRSQAKRKKLKARQSPSGGGSKGKVPAFVLRRNYWRAPQIKSNQEILTELSEKGRTANAVRPVRVKLIPHSEESPWYKYYSAWVKVYVNGRQQSRHIISNSWNEEDPTRIIPCALYYYYYEENNDAMRARRQDAITVLVLEDFYKVPKKSAAGREYFEYVMSMGNDRHGRSLDPPEYQNYEKVFGQQRYLSLYPNQLKEFEEELRARVGSRCGSCGDGELSAHAYLCPNCGHVHADHNVREIPIDEEELLRNGPIECGECGTVALAAKKYECVKKTSRGEWVAGCDNPTSVDPYDCTLNLYAVDRNICVDGFEVGLPDVEIKDYLLRPMDFDLFLGQQDLEDQARSMGRDMPFDANAQSLIDDFFAKKAGATAPKVNVEDEFESYDDDDDDDDINF